MTDKETDWSTAAMINWLVVNLSINQHSFWQSINQLISKKQKSKFLKYK